MTVALALVRWAHFASTLLLFGCACFAEYGPAIDAALRRRFSAVLVTLTTIALASALGWWVCEGGAMTGEPALAFDPRTLEAVLTATAFGHVWVVRLVLATFAIACVPFWGRRGSGRREGAALVVTSGALLVSLAGTGHAVAGIGGTGALASIEDALHLAFAGVWSGGLLGLTIVLGYALKERTWLHGARAAALRFSSVALVATACIAATGILRASTLVGTWQALVATPYGRLLCAKIAAFCIALCLAAVNRSRLRRRRTDAETPEAGSKRLRRGLLYEQVLVQVVILAVAIFGILPPPAELAPEP